MTRKVTEVGQWVAAGDPIVEVISQGRVDAVADVPEHVIDHVKIGDSAEVVIEPLGLAVRGEIAAINPDGGNSARTFPVKVKLDDQGGRLKAGMSVTVWLPVGPEEDYLTVPRDAVSYGVNGQSVWVGVAGQVSRIGRGGCTDADGRRGRDPCAVWRRRAVPAVQPLPGQRSTPLIAGADVVIEGSESLKPGQPLIYADDPATRGMNKPDRNGSHPIRHDKLRCFANL